MPLAACLCCLLAAPEPVWPEPDWPTATPSEVQFDAGLLIEARDYALTGDGSGMILRHGRLVMTWGDLDHRYDIKSSTKSFGATALGLAVKDGNVSLDDPAVKYLPDFGTPPDENKATGWLPKITLRQLAQQVAGFEKPGGFQPLLFESGTQWHYSDGGPNWLADVLTAAYHRDLSEWMFERVFTPLGIRPQDLVWRQNAYRSEKLDGVMRREFGAGILCDVDALARVGYLYLRQGRWRDQSILDPEFVKLATSQQPELVGLPEWHDDPHGNASDHYGLLW